MSRIADELNALIEQEENNKTMFNYFRGLRERDIVKRQRIEKFKKWLNSNNFTPLLNKVIFKHNEDYEENLFDKGIEPHPNNILQFILDVVIEEGESVEIKELDCDFQNTIYEFDDYHFQFILGQGMITRIYKKDDLELIFQI